jgi:hypothetical protein
MPTATKIDSLIAAASGIGRYSVTSVFRHYGI